MTLQESLDRLKEKIEASLPSEYVKIMHNATKELEDSGIGYKILKVGDKAPEFELKNQKGEVISSKLLIEKKPLIITFYRGVWCPYCNTDLVNLNRYTEQFKELEASIVGVSPQIQKFNLQIVEQQRLKFDLLSDSENRIANKFGLRWEMTNPLKPLYKDTFKINLPDYNGDDSWTLPVPARFIIGTDGFVKYAEYSVDYTKRPNPEVLVDALKK